MKNVPSGVLALTGEAVRRQRDAEQRCLDVMLAEGFSLVLLPVLEYERERSGDGYRFVDRSGQVVSLRTDFTPLAARVLGHTVETAPLPLAVCYAGEVVRPRPHLLRQLPELYQLGFERYGAERGAAGSLELTLRLLRLVGVAPSACHVTVSVAGLTEQILARLRGAPADGDLVELMRVHDLDRLREELGLDEPRLAALESALLDGGVTGWPDELGVRLEVDALAPVLAAAGRSGVAASVEVAPRLEADYYRGVVFSVWGERTRAVIAGGGDYEVPTRRGAVPATGACLSLGICLEEASLSPSQGAGHRAPGSGRRRASGPGGGRGPEPGARTPGDRGGRC